MPVIHDDPGLFVHMVTRSEWQGMPPREDLSGDMRKLEKPVVYVRYTSTGTDKCNTFDTCAAAMQDLQEDHVGRQGLVDVKHNFVVGGDGKIYEARGWDNDAERTPEYDFLKGKCIDIAYFGKYKDSNPPWEMLKAGLDLLKHGLKHKHISPNFEIIPYRDDIEKKPN